MKRGLTTLHRARDKTRMHAVESPILPDNDQKLDFRALYIGLIKFCSLIYWEFEEPIHFFEIPSL